MRFLKFLRAAVKVLQVVLIVTKAILDGYDQANLA